MCPDYRLIDEIITKDKLLAPFVPEIVPRRPPRPPFISGNLQNRRRPHAPFAPGILQDDMIPHAPFVSESGGSGIPGRNLIYGVEELHSISSGSESDSDGFSELEADYRPPARGPRKRKVSQQNGRGRKAAKRKATSLEAEALESLAMQRLVQERERLEYIKERDREDRRLAAERERNQHELRLMQERRLDQEFQLRLREFQLRMREFDRKISQMGNGPGPDLGVVGEEEGHGDI